MNKYIHIKTIIFTTTIYTHYLTISQTPHRTDEHHHLTFQLIF